MAMSTSVATVARSRCGPAGACRTAASMVPPSVRHCPRTASLMASLEANRCSSPVLEYPASSAMRCTDACS